MNRRDLLVNSLYSAGAVLGRPLFVSRANAAGDAAPAVETEHGKVRGASVQGVHLFRGIPYGGVTEGSNRFLPPTKPVKWTGVRGTVIPGARCMQTGAPLFKNATIGPYFSGGKERPEVAQEETSENCLALNVLTPGLRGKRPVMVYMHGGGFTNGSSMLTLFADGLAREQDVVLVGINHRLNVFGYLYLGGISDKYAVGNPGQLDLLMALQWVRTNISNFGGDPANVTIWGESGGGGKVNAVMAMPAAKGLFHRAIVESGSTLKVGTPESGTAVAKEVLSKLGLTAGQVEKLHEIPADKLLAAGGGAGPVVDGHTIPQQTWDPKAPQVSATVPMIIGNTKDEMTLFSRDEALFNLDDAALRGRLEKEGISESDAIQLIALYQRDYPKETSTDRWFHMASDRAARRNVILQAELKLDQGQSNVYIYQFVWNTPIGGGRLKAFHTAELPLAMRVVAHPESEALSKQISGAWASFARHGRPSFPQLGEWPAYSMRERATMILDVGRSGVAKDPDREELAILRKYPSKSPL